MISECINLHYYNSLIGCKKGHKCDRLHVKFYVKQYQSDCKYYNTIYGCSKGFKCKFNHSFKLKQFKKLYP